MIRHTCLALASLFALILLLADRAVAADLYWDNDGASVFPFFSDASFWSEDPALTVPATAAPTSGDNIFFSFDGSAYQVILSAGGQATNVTASNGDATLTGPSGTLASSGITTIDDAFAASLVDGARFTLNIAEWDNAGDALVGDAGFGTFTIDGGGNFRALNVNVGEQLGAVGELTVDGLGSTLLTDGPNSGQGYRIGNAGTGTLNVTGGGLARILNDTSGGIADFQLGVTATGEGTLNIVGDDSSVIAEDVFVGNLGNGHLNITAGGVLNQNISTSPDAFVAQATGSSGDVTVHGTGSEWRASRIEIGNLGDGTLSVEAGGFVRSAAAGGSTDMTLGDAGGSGKVAIFGSGGSASRLEVAQDLYIGNLGLGELFVGRDLSGTADGNGTLSIGSDLLIGSAPSNNLDNKVVVSGANATATVGGNLLAGGTIQSGFAGTGAFEARSGATITIGGALAAGGGPDSEGTIAIDGLGTTLTASSMFLGNGNSGPLSTGVMTVSDRAVVTLTSSNNGVVTLGDDANSNGTLTVTGAGSLVQSTGGTAEWWIGGSIADSGGTGTLNVLDGGQVTSTGRMVLGYIGGSTGIVAVDGSGSQIDAGGDYILVGFNGVGNMDVTAGGVVDANRMFVADAPGSAGSQLDIDGAGSVVNIGGLLHVGDSTRGNVNVTGGSQLNVATETPSARLIIGDEAGAAGSRLTVAGAGSRIDYFGTERISVGFSGGSSGSRALLEVLDGAVVQAVQRDGGGAIVSQGFIVVGDEANGNGQIDVDGVGSRIEARYLDLGQSTGASGVANITGGGVIAVTEYSEVGALGTGNSTMGVSGAGSRFEVGGDLSIGAGSTGTNGALNASDGGAITNSNRAFIGRFNGSNGIVNVGGAGAIATWDVGTDLIMAGDRTAFTDSGSQSSGSATLTILPNGVVNVADSLYLKDRGVINLDGGELAAADFVFQDLASRALSPTVNFAAGTLRYTNPSGNTLVANDLDRIFNAGPAVLTPGKHLAVDGTLVLGDELRVDGGELSIGSISTANFNNVDFDAGTFNLTSSNLIIGDGELFGATMVIDVSQTVNITNQASIVAGAQLVVAGGFSSSQLMVAGDLTAIDSTIGGAVINNNNVTVVGEVEFDGLVSGPGDFFGPGTANFNGGIAPGASPAEIVFEGSVALDAANTLFIEIGGEVLGDDYDSLTIAGEATLNGLLDVSVLGGYMPPPGMQFTVLTASDITDNGLVLAGSAANQFDMLVSSTSVVLQAIAAGLDGDYNNDGVVNLADYVVWRDNLGATAGTLPNDPHTGAIGVAQYSTWKSNFGANSASGSAASQIANVPEPSALILLGVGFALTLVSSRRRSALIF